MPERVYIDMGGGEQIPAETWAGATVENIIDALMQASSHPNPESLGLRALLGTVRVPEISDQARALLEELAPDAITHREDQLEEQRREDRRWTR